MPSAQNPAEQTVAALRANYDDLAARTGDLPEDVLIGASGAADWTVADVLSHLGSGAEIATAIVNAAIAGDPAPGQDFNQTVWDRWNALGPAEQAMDCLERSAAFVAVVEAIADDHLRTTQVDLGFMPPMPLSSYLGLRLSETTLHGWDVAVGIDPAAEVSDVAADTLVALYAGDLGFMLRFGSDLGALPGPAVVDIAGSPYSLVLTDDARVSTDATDATATYTGPLPSVVRLLGGRLKPPYVPAGVAVDGNVSLDELRAVFPGY